MAGSSNKGTLNKKPKERQRKPRQTYEMLMKKRNGGRGGPRLAEEKEDIVF